MGYRIRFSESRARQRWTGCTGWIDATIELSDVYGYIVRQLQNNLQFSAKKPKITHISGSLDMSATAASGIPKLLAGPQKSVVKQTLALNSQNPHKPNIFRNRVRRLRPGTFPSGNQRTQEIKHTCRTKVIQRLIRSDFRIERFNCGSHYVRFVTRKRQ